MGPVHFTKVLQWETPNVWQRRKKRTQPPPKENLLENFFWPQRKTFQAGGGSKNPIKTRKAISTTEIFPLWTPFFLQRKVLHWSRAVYGFFSQSGGSKENGLSENTLLGILDPPLLALLDSLLCNFPCFSGAFLLSSPRILVVILCPKSKENRKKKKGQGTSKRSKERGIRAFPGFSLFLCFFLIFSGFQCRGGVP